ncbi:MAG: hypothetical protein Tsb002_06060 [Wenzhouxiangellaceae bacterium]
MMSGSDALLSYVLNNSLVVAIPGIPLLLLEISPWARACAPLLRIGWSLVLLRLLLPGGWLLTVELPAVAEMTEILRPVDSFISLLLLAVWLAGAVLLLISSLVVHTRWRRQLLAGALAAPRSLAGHVQRLRRLCGIRAAVRIVLGDRVSSVMIFGLWRPLIVVPAYFYSHSSRRDLTLALVHELQHLRQADHWLHSAALIINVLFWFHPLAWLARSRLMNWSEYCCDQAVIQRLPHQRHAYRTLLIRQMAAQQGLSAPLPPVAAFSLHHDFGRIHQLQSSARGNLRLVPAVSGLLMLLALSLAQPVATTAEQWLSRQSYEMMPGSLAKQYWLRAQMATRDPAATAVAEDPSTPEE